MKGRPLRTIAIINQKGGCGKTTVSINLAATLAATGRRTLLVDLDPQAHCSLGLAVPESQVDYSIGDVLRAGLDGSMAFADVVWQVSRNLDLAPSRMALAGVEQELSQAPDKDRRLMQVLSTVEEQYEFCVVDCPPSIGLLTFNALRAAGEVLIPVETGFFSLQGAIRQDETIGMLVQRVAHSVRVSVLPTMYDVRTKLAREILAELRRHFDDRLLPVVVHFNSKLKEAASFGQPITEYDATSRGMQDFESLVSWLIANPVETVIEQAGPATSGNPAISRAAELVERARALSARTTALAAKIGAVADYRASSGPAGDEAALADGSSEWSAASVGSRASDGVGAGASTLAAPPPVAEPAKPKNLRGKLAKLFGVRATSKGLLFVQPVNDAGKISIAGDFNNWDPSNSPMHYDDGLGVWQACIDVPPGRYRYRIVCDGQWLQDPYNTYVEANPFGELNSVVEVSVADNAA